MLRRLARLPRRRVGPVRPIEPALPAHRRRGRSVPLHPPAVAAALFLTGGRCAGAAVGAAGRANGGGGVGRSYGELRGLVQGLAALDCLFSLARVAKRGGWVRPEMQRGAHTVDITAGRHPMVEATIGDRYVPNGVSLSHDAQACPCRPRRCFPHPLAPSPSRLPCPPPPPTFTPSRCIPFRSPPTPALPFVACSSFGRPPPAARVAAV